MFWFAAFPKATGSPARRQGRGTFVNDFSTQPLLFSSFVNREGKPFVPEKRRKCVRRILANDTIASRLGLNVDDEVIEMERKHYHGNRPFLTEVSRFPAHIFKVLPEDSANYSVSVLAQRNGIFIGYAEETVTAVSASESDARDLEIPEMTPVISLDRVLYSDRGEILQWRVARAFMRSERFVVKYQ